jgi:biopolymer transport protein ExbB
MNPTSTIACQPRRAAAAIFTTTNKRFPATWRTRTLIGCATCLFLVGSSSPIYAQQEQPSPGDAHAEEALSEQTSAEKLSATASQSNDEGSSSSVPFLGLIIKGGWLMLPIGVMSVIVVMIGIERMLGLRTARILPQALVDGLGEMANRDNFDPRLAYRLCQKYPSAAATVIRAMLLKVGRPLNEVEHSVAEACQVEADRLYTNVRTLNLAAAISPLLGLLGTVWGMIQSFFVTANLPLGSNKGQALAEGIYVALVTTFAGLAVAIPAAVLAHLFEGRILYLIREVEQLLGSLLPQIEKYEGKLRVDQQSLTHGNDANLSHQHSESKAS